MPADPRARARHGIDMSLRLTDLTSDSRWRHWLLGHGTVPLRSESRRRRSLTSAGNLRAAQPTWKLAVRHGIDMWVPRADRNRIDGARTGFRLSLLCFQEAAPRPPPKRRRNRHSFHIRWSRRPTARWARASHKRRENVGVNRLRRSGPVKTGAIRRAGRGARLPVPVARVKQPRRSRDQPVGQPDPGPLPLARPGPPARRARPRSSSRSSPHRLAVDLDRALLDQPGRLPVRRRQPGLDQQLRELARARGRRAVTSGIVLGRRVVLEHPVELGLGRLARARRRGRGRRPSARGAASPRSGAARRSRAAP